MSTTTTGQSGQEGRDSIKKASGTPPVYTPDYRIAIISAFGFAGLLLGLFFLSYEGKGGPGKGTQSGPTGSVFHEIGYSPRDLTGHALDFLIDSLNGAISNNRQKKQGWVERLKGMKVTDQKTRTQVMIDSLGILIKLDSICARSLSSNKNSYEDSSLTNKDVLTTVNHWLHFQVAPDDLVLWDTQYTRMRKDWFANVPCYAKFTVNSRSFYHHDMAKFRVVTYKTNMQFIEKYPGAGIWVFLLLIFWSFCFIAVPSTVYIRREVVKIFGTAEESKGYDYWWSVGAVFLCLAGLYVVLCLTFSDEMPVKALFFMRTLPNIFYVVNGIGCVAGAFCLAGFIHSASMLGHFVNKLCNQTQSILDQRAVVNDTPDADAKKTEQEKLSGLKDGHLVYQDQFRKLLGFFHRYFILSSVLLTLTVLCIGALYNAANSLDFVKLLVANWGYSPAGGDTVYLYGGLYTMMLLLVFLPAKMQFGDVQLELPPDDNDKQDDSSWYSFLEQPFSLLKGGLIAASPFLAGIIQTLMGNFFRH